MMSAPVGKSVSANNTGQASEKEILENILNTLDSYVYVTDPQTDEILFVNQKMDTDFRLNGSSHGEKCWALLQVGQIGRCAFCKKPQLAENPDAPITWEEENPISGNTLLNIDRIIDWPGGRKVHMQQCVDITEMRRTQNMLETMNKAMMVLLTRAEASFEGAMTEGIELISGIVDVDRLSVFCNMDRPDGRHISQIYRWTKEDSGTAHVLDFFQDVSYSALAPRWEGILASGECVSGAVRLMPEFGVLSPFGCVMVLAIPVFDDNKFWGFVFFERFEEKDFSSYETDALRSTSLLLANMVIRHRMMLKIEKQAHLLRTVNKMSAIMMESTADNFDGALKRSLGMLAEATDADRVYVWKNSVRDGRLYITQIYEWSENVTPMRDMGLDPEGPICEILPGTEGTLARGRRISGIVRHMDAELREKLELQAIQAILLMPIFLKEEFWGFIGFDNCHNEQLFSASEERTLRSASEMIAESLIRHNMEENLRATAAQLQTALDEAQSASRAKGEFLSRMSHEMRTPMNAIVGMTSIARGTADNERKEACLDKIDIASKHLLSVINDILDMSKIEANRLELSPHLFNFDKMLAGVADMLNFRISEKRQKFIVSIDEKIPENVIGDELRITQIITNLLTNAVKFTPEGGSVTLNVKCLEDGERTSRVLVEVIDTGIGINGEQQLRLFTAFEQADGSIARKFGGTGLGLAISKHIAELMGGEIWVESKPGQGSKFAFALTLLKSDESVSLPRIDGTSVNILAVDDAAEVREYFVAVTSRFGFHCEVASSGSEALDMIREKEGPAYNFYFIDWIMPGMDGIELVRRIKEIESDNSVIIMISGAEWSRIADEGKKAGVDRFISKPLFPSSIIGIIEDCINRKDETPAPSSISYENHNILIAEDIEINRTVISALLEETGIGIDFAENGAQAISMFEAEPAKYSLIFMDVQMPEMDGFNATRKIRASSCRKASEIPIIAMTANVFREDVDACLAAGMDDHIGKPIEIDTLFEKLNKYISV